MVLAAGCGDSSPPASCNVNGPAEVQLGTGPEDGVGYVPITDGQDVTLTFGQQQGFHVWTNIRAHNVCFSQLKIKRTATLVANGQILITSQDQLSLVPATDPQLAAQGWGELPASRPTFLCPSPEGVTIPGQMLQLKVDITDSQGRTASAQHIVVPQCPNNAYLMRCEEQCAPGSTDGGVD